MKYFLAIVFVIWLVLAAMSARIFREPIERDLTETARAELDRLGLQSVAVEFDHLDATLTGNLESREQKMAAAAAVEAIDGVRMENNHITFGQDLAPRLTFVQGDPVRVTGSLSVSGDALGLGEKFDTSGVVVSARAEAQWQDGVAKLGDAFFGEVTDGRLVLEGRWVTLEGETPNAAAKWRLVDQADAMAANLDVIDKLRVAPSTPFELSGTLEGTRLRFEGELDDPTLRDVFESAFPSCELGGLGIVKTASTPAWLRQLPDALLRTVDLALDAKFEVGADRIAVAATFPSKFWSDAAGRQLHERLPPGIIRELDLKVVQRALPDAAGSPDKVVRPLPIRIRIADKQMHVDGKVRLREERDELLKKLREARPDIEVESSLKYDYREPKLTSIRKALPDFLAFAVTGISGHGTVDLDGERWKISGVCSTAAFFGEINSVASGLRRNLGLPIDVELRLAALKSADETKSVLGDHRVYFKPGSAQVSSLQHSKLEALATILLEVPSSQSVALVGFDSGDARLALQRARNLRRALAKFGVAFDRLTIRTEGAPKPISWQSEQVVVELRLGGDEEEG